MATESGSETTSADRIPKASVSDAPRRQRAEAERPRRKRKRPKKPVFRSEDEVNVPDRQTIGMLGVIALMTLVLWGFARGGCNHHPPRETRRPRDVKVEELLRDPKSSAIELVQRLGVADFKGALELANASAAPAVEQERASCEANASACAERRKKAASVLSTGALLERDPQAAVVRVTTQRPDGKQVLIVHLERENTAWKVRSWEPDNGSFKPKPASSAGSLPFTISTRQVPADQVPADVRERFEKAQAEKGKAPAPAVSGR